MKKIISLLKACMTSDMSLFKINLKNKSKLSQVMIIIIICFGFMSMTFSYASMLLEKLAPFNLQYITLSFFVLLISIFTLIEGIYKSGNLLFNCKDDQLLLSLPIKKSTVLFIRIFKFYVFELLFNSLFIIPLIGCYAFYTKVGLSFFITSFFMIILLPIIPIVISCFIGTIISGVSSHFKYKNAAQIFFTVLLILGVFYLSFNADALLEKLIQNATNFNDLISKIYYPAGAYAKLATHFRIKDLLLFIIINIAIFIMTIIILSKFYFKINSNLKKVSIHSNKNVKELKIKKASQIQALIKKEFNTFFKTPVFIINAGFGIIMYIIMALGLCFKYDSLVSSLASSGMDISVFSLSKPILITIIVAVGSFTTSITSSMVSLEGRNYSIIKGLPVSSKKVLMAKIYTSSILTIPVFMLCNIILFIRFKISLLMIVLISLLTIIMPLVSHFIGLIVNLKFPKLEFANPTEVVKQSMSSFVALIINFITLIVLSLILIKFMKYNTALILTIIVIVMGLIDYLLYLYLVKRGTVLFDHLNN